MYVYGVRSASNPGLGYYLRGVGDDDSSTVDVPVNTTMLYAGAGLLAVAALLFAGRKAGGAVRSYRRSRIRRKRRKLQQQLFAL
jgi:hypothetical protein